MKQASVVLPLLALGLVVASCSGSDDDSRSSPDAGFGGGTGATGGTGGTGSDVLCTNTCTYANDGDCDDGGPNSDYSLCAYGTDCGDCGPRPATSAADAGTGPEPTPTVDWFTTPCSEMGGQLTAAGACGIVYTSDADCPPDTECSTNDVWSAFYCEVTSEVRETRGCGPAGWRQGSYDCSLICFGEGNDSECPPGFRCVESSIHDGEFFCTGYGGSGIGTPACSDCLSSCQGLPGCCTGAGCICEDVCS